MKMVQNNQELTNILGRFWMLPPFNLVCATFLLFSTLAGACPISNTSINQLSGRTIQNILESYFACSEKEPIRDISPCNFFVAKGLFEVYGISDFRVNNDYLSANQIAAKLADGVNGWALIGTVFDDGNSTCAQAMANAGYPVVAALSDKGHGHVALVIPGKLGSGWHSEESRARAPNSASFFLNHPNKGYVGKPLNHAFRALNARRAYYYYHDLNPYVISELERRDRGLNPFDQAPLFPDGGVIIPRSSEITEEFLKAMRGEK